MGNAKRVLVGLAPAAAVLVALASCSGSDGGSADGEDGGSSGSSGSNGSSGTPIPKDGAPGCASIGPKNASSATSTPRDGMTTAAWTSPESALGADDARAQAILSTSVAATDELRITKFGFSVPAGARITGIEVDMRRQAKDIGAIDDKVQLIQGGNPVGRYKYVNTAWPSSAAGTHPYGGESDTFGATLTGADVSREDFGVSISAKLDVNAVSSDPAVDVVTMTVHYCE